MQLKSAAVSRLYVLAVFSTLLLAMGQSLAWFALVMAAAAIVAYAQTEKRQRFRLSVSATNWLCVAGLGLFAIELAVEGILTLAMAHLAVYLQLVVLFQKKETATYWNLALLAFMQVPVAAVLSLRIWFGVLLVIYLFVALLALTLFYLYRERSARVPEGTFSLAVVGAGGDRLWPLASAPSRFGGIAPATELRPFGLRVHTAVMGLLTLPVAVAVFVLAPRAPMPEWGQAGGVEQIETGYAETVQLGRVGEILESDEPVLKLTVRDALSDVNLGAVGELLLRGGVLLDYSEGQWSDTGASRGFPIGVPSQRAGLIRQEIELEPVDSTVLFAAWPVEGAVRWEDGQSLAVDFGMGTITRPSGSTGRSLRYRVYSSRAALTNPPLDLAAPTAQDRVQHLSLPREQLPTLVATAERITSGLAARDLEGRSRALENYLRSAEFGYLLDARPVNRDIDPVEDFLANRKAGHCEFFASALTLMLRSVGIPARIVHGFRVEEWNKVGEFYQVRQGHAHRWVEAYVGGRTGWLTLDPTPMQRQARAERTWWMAVREYRTYLYALWSRHVVGFDSQQQGFVLAGPLAGAVDSWRRWGQRQLLGRGRAPWRLPWEGALMVVGAVLLLTGIATILAGRWAGREPRRRAKGKTHWRRWLPWGGRTTGEVRVYFYEELTRLLKMHHWVREPAQTSGELALAVCQHLCQEEATKRVADVAPEVVAAYYRVRYGGRTLAAEDRRRIERALGDLADTLQRKRRAL